MNGGDVIFNFKGDTNDLEKSSSGIGSKVKGLASGVLKGTAVIGTALAGVTAKSVQMAGELEQQIGGTEAVFGSFASNVQKMSDSAFSSMGLSSNDYMATMNKMGALMQGSGIDIETSMNLSSQAMQRASDVASIMGIDVNMAMESIAGASKGNFTMMDNLGVAMNATSIEAYALSKGINKSYNEMTKAEQVQMAMEMFLEKSAYATGNYTKENETFAGSLSTMKASISNLMAGTGDIDDTIKAVSNFGKIIVKSVGEMAPKIVSGITGLINGIMPLIPDLLANLLPSVVNGVVALAQGVINALPTLLTMLAGMLPTILQSLITGLIQIVNSLATMLPTLIPTIIQAVLGLIPVLLQNLPLFLEAGIQLILGLATGLVNAIPQLIEMLPQIIESLISGLMTAIPQVMTMAPRIILALATGLIKAIPTLVKNIPQIVKAIINGLASGVSGMFNVGENLIIGLWNGIKNVTGWITDKIKGFGKSILNSIKGIFGIKSPSKEFEYIGKMNVVGMENGFEKEKGELQDTFDSMFGLSPSLYGSSSLNMSPNVNVIVNNNMKQDALGQLVNDVKTFSGGAKNDYNYGTGV